MTNKIFSRIGRFFRELREVAGTPFGDTRGHVRDSYPKPAPRDRI